MPDVLAHVDDGFCYYNRGNKAAEAELDELAKRFKIKIVDDPKQFLGLNTDAKGNGELKVSMQFGSTISQRAPPSYSL